MSDCYCGGDCGKEISLLRDGNSRNGSLIEDLEFVITDLRGERSLLQDEIKRLRGVIEFAKEYFGLNGGAINSVDVAKRLSDALKPKIGEGGKP